MKSRIVEAREWLMKGKTFSIGDHDWCSADEDTHDNAVETVKTLYDMGATKVEVEVYEDNEWAQTLLITLPEDPDASRKIIVHIAGGFMADEVDEEDGVLEVAWVS